MITIAIFNNKGGVGKTTAAINIAHAMTKLGKRVLVIDCDSQRNSFGFFSDESNGEECCFTRYENLFISDDSDDDPFELCYTRYNYVIADLPPTLDERTKQNISCCDFVFVPIELGTFAISGIAKVTETIAETGAKFGGCFVNKFDRENPADFKLDELLRRTLGNKVMTARIPYSRVIKNSISYRQTAFEYMEWSSPAAAYMTLTNEIITICEGGKDNA